ncbi:MAG: amidohydrolase family protein [Sporomusaceae bacterium]|nr:amidohydrolase family protein [Sporomusaceae bacterium]
MTGKKSIIACFLITALALAAFAGWSPRQASGEPASDDKAAQIKLFEQRIRTIRAGQIPIIDVEQHWGGKLGLKELTDKMDRNGVALTWLGPNEKLGNEYSLRASRSHPGYFVPTTIHGDGPLWHGKHKDLLDSIAAAARSGQYFAMGEFEARHYPSSTNNRDIHLPLTSESFRAIFALSQETGIPFLIHHEAEDALLPEMEAMLAEFPGAKVVWCHVGRNRNPATWRKFQTPSAVRHLLEKYPNLYFDLVQSPPGAKYRLTGYVEGIMYDLGGDTPCLERGWRQLLIDHADRFVLGSDVNTGRWDGYDSVFQTFRSVVLSDLPRDAAEKIAFKNAWRLMTGQVWAD